MAKLIIKKKKNTEKTGFYALVKYMHGDADGWSTKTYGPFAIEQIFLDFLDCLGSAAISDWHAVRKRHGGDSDLYAPTVNKYWNELLWEWEEDVSIPEEKQEYITEDLIQEIEYCPEYDHTCDWYFACPREIYLYYIDENSSKFSVQYEPDNHEYIGKFWEYSKYKESKY